MIQSLRLHALTQSPHAQGAGNLQESLAAAQVSKSHQAEDLQKSASRQKIVQWVDPEMTEEKVLLLERKGIVLVGVEIARHMVDLWA